MRLKTMMTMFFKGQSTFAMKLMRTVNEFYRTCFVSTALSEGIYDILLNGPVGIEWLGAELGPGISREGLQAWLDLGVSLGELERGKQGYRIKGALSKRLARPENDPYRAFLEEIAINHYPYITQTPSMLKRKKRFEFDESPGELIARSSRVSEPFIMDVVEEAIPRSGPFRLLEVGCGSGIYIKRACERNSSLSAVGLELQPRVAELARKNIESWGLSGRALVETTDVRMYQGGPEFDLVTLHQNIYYFKVDERVELARYLIGFLKPGGRLLLTTACQGGSPAIQALNIWVSVTEGYGALPDPEELCEQLEEAGFSKVWSKRLIPFESFRAFIAEKPGVS
ncbi:MAG: methyltransferase domain-containing protein [Deltaproteobacteria bacterium]|nr:MAG: methyltransferase domain-containing protein [Deltaproteobacteria bacterium]